MRSRSLHVLLAVLLCLALPLVTGCKGLASQSADTVAVKAALLRSATSFGVSQGLAALERSKPEDAAKIRAGVREASAVLRGTVLPLLTGAPAEEWTAGLVDRAIVLAHGKIPDGAKPVIQAALEAGLAKAGVGSDPAAKLGPNARVLVTALFAGLADGAEVFLST